MTFLRGTIRCTNCGETKHYDAEGWPYSNGWARRIDGGHECPSCAKVTADRLIRALLRDAMPNARELERFEMGDAQPVAGVLNYRGGPEKGAKVQCYLSAGESELVALKSKKVTKAGGGVAVGSIVLKVAWHGPLDKVLGFTPV